MSDEHPQIVKKMPTLILLNFEVYQDRECDDELEGTLLSWFVTILFLPYQNSVMDHSWVLAMNHIYKNKEPCLIKNK